LVSGLSLSGIFAAFLLGTLTWRALGPSGFLLVASYFIIVSWKRKGLNLYLHLNWFMFWVVFVGFWWFVLLGFFFMAYVIEFLLFWWFRRYILCPFCLF
jgi:hypothetical protein